MVVLHMLAVIMLHLLSQPSASDAAFSASVRCPCATSLAASWEFTLQQAMLVSDVVMMGRVLELREGMGGMMNASIASMITYKGHISQGAFLTRVDNVTNFDKDAPREMALFFFALEPTGNLALQCMSLLTALNAVGDLKTVLDFVRDIGRQSNKENEKFVPLIPSPCSATPSPCSTVGSFCTVTNTLPGQTFRCTCLTGYVGNGHICEILERPSSTPTPSPVHPVCGGVSTPLLDILGNTESCNEGDIPELECPPMHYCHHGICCPVTPPSTMSPVSLPSPPASPPPSPSYSTTPTPSPVAPPPDTDDCGSGGSGGSGDEETGGSGRCVERGSGHVGSGDGGSGGSGDGGSGSGDSSDSSDGTKYTFEDDEDMAYGQGRR